MLRLRALGQVGNISANVFDFTHNRYSEFPENGSTFGKFDSDPYNFDIVQFDIVKSMIQVFSSNKVR